MSFKKDVLDKAAENGVLMRSGDKSVTQGSYEYDALTINGENIGKYRIVYPQWNDRGELSLATALRTWITEKTGYVLECVSDVSAASDYEINIGDTSHITDEMRTEREKSGYSQEKSYIGVNDKTLWLSGSNYLTLHAVTAHFIRSMEYSDKTLAVNVSESRCVSFSGSFELSVMNYNVYYDLSERARNLDDLISSVKQKSPDVFGLNEAGKDWIDKFNADETIRAVYGCAEGKPTDNASDASYNPVFYRKDRFEVVDVVTKWLSKTPNVMSKDSDAKHYKIITCVTLKDKASGTEFMYFNTHLDGSGDAEAHAAMKELRKRQAEIIKDIVEAYPFIPVIVAGDFNEGPSSAVVGGMSQNTRLRYCMNIADVKVNLNSTDVNNSWNEISDGVVFDYIFVSGDCISVKKYEQWDNKTNGKYPSDHLPVYAELTIKY